MILSRFQVSCPRARLHGHVSFVPVQPARDGDSRVSFGGDGTMSMLDGALF